MSYTTYKKNDIVYIKDIGYGTLVDCGKYKILSVKSTVEIQRNQSLHFDPDIFNSDDSNKSHKKQEQPAKVQPVQLQKQQSKMQSDPKNDEQTEIKEIQKPTNIVTIKLYGTDVMVYVPDQHIRKYVDVPVKAFFGRQECVFNIRIDINKNVEFLKKQIFDHLGLKIAYYYNVKMYVTSPWLCDLNTPSRTIYDCKIGENTRLIITGKHAFCFDILSEDFNDTFILANSNMTLVSKQKSIALPPIPQIKNKKTKSQPEPNKDKPEQKQPTQQQPQQQPQKPKQQQKQKQVQTETKTENQQKILQQQKIQKKQQEKIEQPIKKQEEIPINIVAPPSYYYFYGDQCFMKGFHYWEVKLDKLPSNHRELSIGIATNQHIYQFLPLVAQRSVLSIPSEIQPQQKYPYTNLHEINDMKMSKNYGYSCKQGQSIGILIQFSKNSQLKVSFYRNNIWLGKCFSEIKGAVKPIFSLGEKGQISIDTRIQCPIDSYRRR